jgi:ABC-type multidrug transport system permease subunit
MPESTLIGSAEARHSAWTLLRYRVWSIVHGNSLYVLAVGTLILVAAIMNDFLAFVKAGGITISQNPFQTPSTIALHLAAIYLALSVTVSMSREREQGTLLVLSFGPLTPRGYLLSWLGGQMLAYLILCVMLTLGLAGVATISGLELSGTLFTFAALSTPVAATTIAFGILVGSLGRDTRGSIFIFLAVTFFLVGLEALNAYFVTLTPEQVPSALVPVSRTVALVSVLLIWISPYSYLTRGLNAIYSSDWRTFTLVLVGAFMYVSVLLLLAHVSFNRKGVQP